MIRKRPASLLTLPFYRAPPLDMRVDMGGLPELLKRDMIGLSGIQPITGTLAKAAGAIMRDNPSDAEIEIHRANGSRFQLVQVVASVFDVRAIDGVHIARPYALSLIPAMKRGAVETVSVDWLKQIDLERNPFSGRGYLNFDPFTLDPGMSGPLALFAQLGAIDKAFTDEIGIVTDGYFLTRPFHQADVLMPGPGMANADANARYRRHQLRTYFKWFGDGRPRRVWGLESPIELFLAQEMARRDLRPDLQTMFLRDGSTYPSLYELMSDPAFKANPEVISTADFFFSEHKLAVFYDSVRHHRSKAAQDRDARISQQLERLGIRVLRLSAKEIAADLGVAVDRVAAALVT